MFRKLWDSVAEVTRGQIPGSLFIFERKRESKCHQRQGGDTNAAYGGKEQQSGSEEYVCFLLSISGLRWLQHLAEVTFAAEADDILSSFPRDEADTCSVGVFRKREQPTDFC